MAQCFKCGKKGVFLSVHYCVNCSKTACADCYTYIPTIDPTFYQKVKNEQYSLFQKKKEAILHEWLNQPINSPLNRWVYLCSNDCRRLFLLNKKAFTFEYIRDQKELYIPVKIPINPKIPPESDNYQAQLTDGWILRAALIPELQNVFDEVVNLSDTHRKSLTEREKTLEKAKNYEMAYRMEEAAKIYEELGLWAEAGRVRKKAQETITKNLTVDVNQLLEQLREGNISTTYNCANCGADIAIDGKTDANGLRFCNFCGTAIKIQDLTEVIQKVI